MQRALDTRRAGCATTMLAQQLTSAASFLALASAPVAFLWAADRSAADAQNALVRQCVALALAADALLLLTHGHKLEASACFGACVVGAALAGVSVATALACGPFAMSAAAWACERRPATAARSSSIARVRQRRLAKRLSSLSSKRGVRQALASAVPRSTETLHRCAIAVIAVLNSCFFLAGAVAYAGFGGSLQMAHGFGKMLYVDVALLALPVLHRTWGALARAAGQSPPGKGFKLHRLLAALLAAAAVGHALAHGANVSVLAPGVWPGGVAVWATGWLLLALLIGMLAAGYVVPRDARLLGATHALGVPAALGLLLAHAPALWPWCLPGLALLVLERALSRAVARHGRTFTIAYASVQDAIVHLRFDGHLALRGGEYVYVKVPAVNAVQWRPFTVVPTPRGDGFELHVRARTHAGSWTAQLKALADAGALANALAIVDGPHVSATGQFRRYDRIVLVATGVGATTVSSVLRALYCTGRTPAKVRSVTVVVAIRWGELASFGWVVDDLVAASRSDMPYAFKAHVHVTGGGAEALPRAAAQFPDLFGAVVAHADGAREAVEVAYARPCWADVFAQEVRRNGPSSATAPAPTQSVGVFVTGPPELYRAIKLAVDGCAGYSVKRETF